MKKFEVGDPIVVITEFTHRPEKWNTCTGKVTKVGRKYVTAEYTETSRYGNSYSSESQFDMKTGLSTNEVGCKNRIFTVEEYEDYSRRQAALESMGHHGLVVEHKTRDLISTEQLVAIAKILEG